MTTVTSPPKPRLITIPPRKPSSAKTSSQSLTPLSDPQPLVSAFSPDTPSETFDVVDPGDDGAEPGQSVTEQRLASLDIKSFYPYTPPSSRTPTPTPSACLQDHSYGGPPTTTRLDSSITWILQEFEVLLAHSPTATLRLDSPVIRRIRGTTSDVSAGNSAGHRYFIAPGSRYSLYRPVSSHPISNESYLHTDQSPRAIYAPSAPQADPTALALGNILPQARPHQIDSLQATYLALQFIVDLPLSMASSSDVPPSPFTTAIKHSRSLSIVFEIPAKVRAMLGLDPPVRSSGPLLSPAVS